MWYFSFITVFSALSGLLLTMPSRFATWISGMTHCFVSSLRISQTYSFFTIPLMIGNPHSISLPHHRKSSWKNFGLFPYYSAGTQLPKEDDFTVAKSNIHISIGFNVFLSSSQYYWPTPPSWNTFLPFPSVNYTSSCPMGHSNTLCFLGFSARSPRLSQQPSGFLYLPSHILELLIPLCTFSFQNHLPVPKTSLV